MELEKDKKFNVEFENLIILYKHYKDYLLPLGVILACVLMVIFVIVPQFEQYFSLQDQLKIETQKLTVLKSNYLFLSNLDNASATSDLNTLSLALPQNKDFAGIMNSISFVSAKTGVSVGDFEFSVGNLSNAAAGVISYPSISIDVNLVGSTQAIMQFITELYKTAPASEVTNIKIGGHAGSITVLFYYKTFSLQNVDQTVPIVALSAKDTQLIKDVSTWNNVASGQIVSFTPSVPTETASSSGSNTSPF
jgi:Tfp pilus assembly protein PilO